MISISGANNVRIEGITFENSKSDPIGISGSENCEVAGCSIRNISGGAGWVADSKKCGFRSCNIYNIGSRALSISGLNRIYSAAEKKFINSISGDPFGSQFRGNCGTVSVKLKNSIKIKTGGGYASYITEDFLPLEYSAVYVSRVGKNGKRVLEVGTKSDIAVGDYAVYTTRVGQDFRIIIYK